MRLLRLLVCIIIGTCDIAGTILSAHWSYISVQCSSDRINDFDSQDGGIHNYKEENISTQILVSYTNY